MTIEELFGTLQQSIVAEWRKHLKTSKYSKHMALDEFYTEMPELVDTLIEDYNGHMGTKVENFKNILDAEKLDALEYLEELHKICQDGYKLLPDDAPEIKSDLDAIKSKIDSVMYKVRELKEQYHMKPLKDFLTESLSNSIICENKLEMLAKELERKFDWNPLDILDYMDHEPTTDPYDDATDTFTDEIASALQSKQWKKFIDEFNKSYKGKYSDYLIDLWAGYEDMLALADYDD